MSNSLLVLRANLYDADGKIRQRQRFTIGSGCKWAVGPRPGERSGPKPITPQRGSLRPYFLRSIQGRSGSLACFSVAVRQFVRPCHLPFGSAITRSVGR